MSEISRILDQMRRAYAGEAWHGPSVLESLDGITASQAAARPLPPAHNVWEITGHIAAWKSVVKTRLTGGRRTLSDAENFPPAHSGGDAEWTAALAELQREHEALLQAAEALRDEELGRPITAETSLTLYHLLHGVVQHDLYHAGQIVLLRKAL